MHLMKCSGDDSVLKDQMMTLLKDHFNIVKGTKSDLIL